MSWAWQDSHYLCIADFHFLMRCTLGCAGVQSHLAANARFPRAPLDVRNAPSSPSASIRSGTTSIRAQQGE